MERNPLLGELAAEFAGTAILILIGTGVVVHVSTDSDVALGDHDSISWAGAPASRSASTSRPASRVFT